MKNATNLIKSPMNYIGGKYKLLPQILPLFPTKIDTFVDLFCGGLDVTLNVNANKIIANDRITQLIDIYIYMLSKSNDEIVNEVEEIISKYELSKTNKCGYLKLRQDYNLNKSPILLLVLCFFSFNHQIRFNNKLEFNMPFGENRSSYNETLKNNLIASKIRISKRIVKFVSDDFANIHITNDCFVYADPPYLITTGTYNESSNEMSGWSEEDDARLFSYLDELNSRGIKFAMSNVFSNKGRTNHLLIDWSKKYDVYHLLNTYNNATYNRENEIGAKSENDTDEVLIVNYKPETNIYKKVELF